MPLLQQPLHKKSHPILLFAQRSGIPRLRPASVLPLHSPVPDPVRNLHCNDLLTIPDPQPTVEQLPTPNLDPPLLSHNLPPAIRRQQAGRLPPPAAPVLPDQRQHPSGDAGHPGLQEEDEGFAGRGGPAAGAL